MYIDLDYELSKIIHAEKIRQAEEWRRFRQLPAQPPLYQHLIAGLVNVWQGVARTISAKGQVTGGNSANHRSRTEGSAYALRK